MTLRFERLSRTHDRAAFTCGVASLDAFLQRSALQNARDGLSTTHVLVQSRHPKRILGYLSASTAEIELAGLQPADRRGLPRYPVPALRLVRLAVATSAQGRGHGELMLGEAVRRALAVREQAGVRVLLVDALDERAAGFYQAYGFRPTTRNGRLLYLPLG